MPKTPKNVRRQNVCEARAAECEEFEAGLKRSTRGNLWREWEGARVSVFRRRSDDLYGWSVHYDDESPHRYSREGYETEEAAIFDLWHEVRTC